MKRATKEAPERAMEPALEKSQRTSVGFTVWRRAFCGLAAWFCGLAAWFGGLAASVGGSPAVRRGGSPAARLASQTRFAQAARFKCA